MGLLFVASVAQIWAAIHTNKRNKVNEKHPYEKLRDMSALQAVGKAFCDSGIFGCENQAQGVTLAMQCIAENKPPLEMAKRYYFVSGRLTVKSDVMLADFRHVGGKLIFEDLNNREIAKAKVYFEDYDGLEVSYSLKDAEVEGLLNNGNPNWKTRPATMLRKRLISNTITAIAPEIAKGLMTDDEAQDAADVELMQSANDKAQARIAERETKPEPKQAESVEAEIVDDERDAIIASLDAKIAKSDSEKKVNAYYESKGDIDGLEQTWRDLPAATLKRINAKWNQFCAQALGGAK